MFVEVALDLPIDQTFYYRVPKVVSYLPEVGKRVIVPFGKNDLLKTGIILSIKDSIDYSPEKVKEIFDIPDNFPLFAEKTLELTKWISNYYCASIGETLFAFLPSGFVVSESFYIKLSNREISVNLTESEEKIVEILKSASGRLKLSSLRRKVKVSSFYQAIKNLIYKGIIVREEFIKTDLIPKEEFVVLKRLEKVRGKKEKELLQYLETLKKAKLSDLKRYGFTRQTVNKLVSKGLVEIIEEKTTIANKPQELIEKKEIELTPSQKRAFEEILEAKTKKFLLYGVTGSGKMEVYLKTAFEFVKRGRSVLILVPELLLTPELRARVESYFGSNIGIYHGKLSQKEKVSTWLKAVKGETKVFIGTRGAVMLPIKDLGLIIVDEEQDSSYKEQQKPYYHAREVAIKRSELDNFPIVLVSATPSVETYYRVKKKEIRKLELKERVSNVPLPYIKVVNLQKSKRFSIFSEELLKTLENTVKKGEQVFLFINRRGFFSTSFCLSCGFIVECEDCCVPLTYHKQEKQLICHMCGKRYKPIYRCPKCNARLEFKGYGTERVEEELRILYPNFKIVRLDQDTIKNPSTGARIIKDIKEGKYDVIVGTQIASKGHNFPKLTLVGVLMADLLGGAPDYMASERIFQTIVHTTGRAGRFKPGAAIVQTFNPELPAIKWAVEYKFNSFYEEELVARKLLNYPPFTKGVLVEFQLEKISSFQKIEKEFGKLKETLSSFFSIPDISPAPLPKVSGKYRFISFFRAVDERKLLSGIKILKKEFLNRFKGIRYKIEVDPVRIV